jgi:hypothetical protein
MKEITGWTATREQSISTRDESGERIRFTLRYAAAARQWFLDITYKTFTLNNYRIVISYNLIRRYSPVLGFGILITSTDGDEPFMIDDSSRGRIGFYLLNTAEIEAADHV